GPWAVNLGAVLTKAGANGQPEWPNLFLGSPTVPTLPGRYGPDGAPSGTAVTGSGLMPHFYGQVDFDESNNPPGNVSGGTATTAFTLPTFPGGGSTNPFGQFPAGYGNGDATERQNHPATYNVFAPVAPTGAGGNYDRRFAASTMERLLRFGD